MKNSMHQLRPVFILTVLLGLFGLAIFFLSNTRLPSTQSVPDLGVLVIGDDEIRIEYARTKEERERGLSGRAQLASGEGLLFVFPLEGMYGFWMPEMRFSIDIIWIDRKMRIVDIAQNVSPESYPTVYKPISPARYVLEVSASTVQKRGWHIGDIVAFATQ